MPSEPRRLVSGADAAPPEILVDPAIDFCSPDLQGPARSRLVAKILLDGKPHRSRDIAALIADQGGVLIRTEQISAILSRMANPARSNLGYFIHRHKEGPSMVYRLDPAALALTPDQAYGLTIRRGGDTYPLGQAISDHPALARLIPGRKPASGFRVFRSFAAHAGGRRSPGLPGKRGCAPVNLSVRCSSRCAMNITAPPLLFLAMGLGFMTAAASVGVLIYVFFFHLVMVVLGFLGLTAAGMLLWKCRHMLLKRSRI